MKRPFAQVDVFSSEPLYGNPVAVVLDADGMSTEQMAAFARWTNLSETTFVLPADDTRADYRMRIFTPAGELPFAGHPTLGTAHAWLQGGGTAVGATVVAQCEAGLIEIRSQDDRLAFAAPVLTRSGPVDEEILAPIRAALRLAPADVVDAAWVCNGPSWIGLLLDSGQRVREVVPDMEALGRHELGIVGAYGDAAPGQPSYEVRAFAPGQGVPEDPITGSLNAGLAIWLRAKHGAPRSYIAAQGTVIGRRGRVFVDDDGERIWVGGQCSTVLSGSVEI